MTDTKAEIARLESELLPLKNRRVLERSAVRDGAVNISEWHYAVSWALLQLLPPTKA